MALYVFGVMRSADAAQAVASGEAERLADVHAVEHGPIAALVRALPGGTVRLARDSIMSHSGVLQEAFAHGPVLPFRFGTVLPDEETVQRELLASEPDRFSARLDALAGKVEMQVRASYLEEPLLRSILGRDPRLAAAAQRIKTMPPAATHFERIRLGEAVASAVDAHRKVDSERLLGALHPLAEAAAVGEPRTEHMVLNASFLVARDQLESFDAVVERLSEEHGSRLEFKLIGPLPAYSFANGEAIAFGSSSRPSEVTPAWA